MSVLAAHRFSALDYHRMIETGVLSARARVELLDGQIVDMSPIGPLHGGVTNYLNQYFNQRANQRFLVVTQNPVRLDDHSEPQPDLMLCLPARDYFRARHPVPAEVFLLVEVADTTLAYDQGQKLAAYARACVKEVWIVNLTDLTVEVYREPMDGRYESETVVHMGEAASPLTFPDLKIDVQAMLGGKGG